MKKFSVKKVVTVLVAFSLCFTIVPFAAFAQEGPVTEEAAMAMENETLQIEEVNEEAVEIEAINEEVEIENAENEAKASMIDILYEMREKGASIEEMARAISIERNRIRLESYKDDPQRLKIVKESNLKTYGHEEGPTPDQLYDKLGSWTSVIQSAFGTNMGMDACCGLYDEYYQLYVELGYVD